MELGELIWKATVGRKVQEQLLRLYKLILKNRVEVILSIKGSDAGEVARILNALEGQGLK